MAYPQVVGSQLSSRASGAVDDTVLLPASIASGDLIIVFHYSDGTSTRTWAGSWIEIQDYTYSTGSVGIAYLIASGSETSVTVTKDISERFTAIAIRISAASWHGTTAPEIGSGNTGSSTTPNCGSLTPSWGAADTLWIAAMGWDASLGTETVDAYPLADNNIVSDAVSSASRGAICTDEINTSSESPGTYTINQTDEWAAWTLGVRPASGGGIVIGLDTA